MSAVAPGSQRAKPPSMAFFPYPMATWPMALFANVSNCWALFANVSNCWALAAPPGNWGARGAGAEEAWRLGAMLDIMPVWLPSLRMGEASLLKKPSLPVCGGGAEKAPPAVGGARMLEGLEGGARENGSRIAGVCGGNKGAL